MSQRVFLVEPKQLHISRSAIEVAESKRRTDNNESYSKKIADSQRGVRSAGDGMEWNNDSQVFQHTAENRWHEEFLLKRPMATSTPASRDTRIKQRKDIAAQKASKRILKDIDNVDSVQMMREKLDASYKIELENLRSKESYLETLNEKLVEEKLKLSKQLGIQSQVNTELKTLLVASVGEDLEEKLEKMTLNKATSERLIKKLKDQLEERQEELESMTIQNDVWRSKFLASKVMTDELASLKALADSNFRDCSSALETLLQEHFQVATTIASSNRFLLRLAQLIGCNKQEENLSDPSSIDLAIMNHNLARQVTHAAMQDLSSIKPTGNTQSESLSCTETKAYGERSQALSEGERKAKKALDNSRLDECERSKSYLNQRYISQILATKYPMRCLTCKGCKGPLVTV